MDRNLDRNKVDPTDVAQLLRELEGEISRLEQLIKQPRPAAPETPERQASGKPRRVPSGVTEPTAV
jgi:hypothetical protein